ncbi:hypothetical protein [Mycobacteroides abscessus]|uniref:glycine-rich domain-containing protein n=2 Tax=Mycobacteroides abscessus TaxID=36809 RepID=UPI000241BCFE|nr:hypothetical protein [Mycobacteroides abscessus]EHM15493.1 hypothetical protein MMAS_38730 [Mycobacteroides abscessus subsp. massiliense CCUG 48898 = JCM 15300]EIV65127.1 hypothetical protein MMCCUG48898_4044 [Mycobacteroides abscessus subsp. massiliense CCUG 48898 = JCM 15300]WJJ56599.1 minor tail protein [Mycobacterium phage prophiCCUG48898T-1]BAP98791.1 hypothetical protein MMASJCM_4015 [Mycobacteroides abscessus subsp. massiliense CCUG 48898 = JCM 15300]
MSDNLPEIPDWARDVPSAPVHREQGGGLTRPFTAQQLQEFGKGFVEQFLGRVVLAVMGHLIPGVGSFDQLREWAKDKPGLGDLVELLTGIEDGDENDLGTWALGIRNALAGIDLAHPESILTAIAKVAGQFLKGVIPASWVADVAHDLLGGAGGFTDPKMVEDNPYWRFDAAQNGHLSGKSIYLNADGQLHAISIKDPFNVAAGQAVDISASAMWQGVSAAVGSNPIRLCITPFAPDGTKLPDIVIKKIQPVAADSSWIRASLSGSWTVPTDGSVKSATVTLVVTEGATAGRIHFSNVTSVMSNLGPLLGKWRSFFDTLGGKANSDIADFEQRFAAITADGKITAEEIIGLLGLGNIPKLPPAKVHSPIGSTDIGEDLKDTWNNFWNAVFGDGSSGRGPVDVSTATAALKKKADDAYAAAVYATDVVNLPRLTPRWMSTGINDDVSFPIINAQSTFVPADQKLVFIPITPGVERTYRTVKFAITGNGMTQCYVGVYRINESLQIQKAVDLGNVKARLSGTSRVQALTIPSPGLTVPKGHTAFIGVLQVGNPQGLYTTPAMPTVLEVVQNIPLFFTQDGGTGYTSLPTLVGGHVEFTPVWGALGESTNLADQWTEYSPTGSNLPLSVYDIPSASTVLYLAGCGGGGGGGGGDGGWNKPGEGGGGGSWNSLRLERGVDIPVSVTQITVQSERVGSPTGIGGEPGSKETDGKPGHDIVFRNGTDNSEILRCAGGRLGRLAYGSFYNRDSVGYGPGDLGFSARLFKGGQNTPPSASVGAANGAPGNGPGGGGAGGAGGTGGSAGTGGWGAAGYAAIKAV